MFCNSGTLEGNCSSLVLHTDELWVWWCESVAPPLLIFIFFRVWWCESVAPPGLSARFRSAAEALALATSEPAAPLTALRCLFQFDNRALEDPAPIVPHSFPSEDVERTMSQLVVLSVSTTQM